MQNRLLLFCAALLLHLGLSAHLLLNPIPAEQAKNASHQVLLQQYFNGYQIRNGQMVFQEQSTAAELVLSGMSFTLDSDQTVEECSGSLFDSGGADGEYQNGEDFTFTIINPSGGPLTLDLTFFETESNFDFVTFYDGPDASSPEIARISGIHTGESYSSTAGSITINFDSDGSVTRPGFEITWGAGQGTGPSDASVTTSTTTPLINQPVVFTPVSPSSSSLIYDFGDGSELVNGDGPTSHSYTAAGTYQVTVVDNNCTEQDTTVTTIEVAEGTTFSVDPNSIWDTLLTDQMASHVVTITNTGTNPGYFGVTVPTGGTPFFSIDGIPADGTTLQPGENVVLTISLDATGLFPALYEETIQIITSDSEESIKDFSIKLRVVGVPGAEYSTTSLNFGQLFVGETGVQEFTISSTGTDSLVINSMVSNDARFETAQSAPFGIAATEDSTIQLNFQGSPTTGLIFGRLTVNTNAGNQNINFIAEIVEAPVATVTPDSICVTIDAGTTLDTFVQVQNSGLTALTYQFSDNIIDSSLMVFSDETGPSTTHTFTDLPPLPYNMQLQIKIQGNFGQPTQFVSVIINGVDYGRLTDNNRENVEDILYFPLPAELLNTGELEVVLQNSNQVFSFFGYANRHEVFLVSEGHDWLSFNEDTSLLSPQSTFNFPLTLDATNLYGGEYLAHLNFASNDPLLRNKTIPVKLNVIGIPDIASDRDTLDFGSIQLTTSNVQTVRISNPGTQALVIESTSIASGQYAADQFNFTVPPGQYQDVNVIFAPSIVGELNSVMTLSGPTHTLEIPILGTGLAVPQAQISRDTICVTLEQGQSTTETVTISNLGEGDLVYDAGLGGVGNRVLVWSRESPDNSFDNMMSVLTEPALLLDVNVTSTSDSSEMSALLANTDVLVFHNMNFVSFDITSTIGVTILSWLNDGGRLILAGNAFSSVSNNMNLHDGQFHATYNGLAADINISNEDHPLLENINFPLDLEGELSYVNGIVSNDDVTVIASNRFAENQGIIFTQTQGTGEVVFLGYNYAELSTTNSQLLRNAVEYTRTEIPFPGWLTVDNTNGTLTTDNSSDINATFDAGSLVGGVYTFPLSYSMNQPNNELALIVMKMNIITAPVPVFSSLNQVSCNGEVAFTDESTQTPTSWEWNFGDGNSSTDQNPTHTYASSGEYTVTLTVCNDLGCNTSTIENFISVQLENPFCIETSFENQTSTQISGCGGVIFSPGFANGSYPNNIQGAEILITSGNGGPIRLSIISFQLEGCCDFFTAYDGTDNAAPVIGTWNGTDLMPGDEILSTGGSIFLTFSSDFSVTLPGFEIRWQCAQAIDNVALSAQQQPGCPATYAFEALNGIDEYQYTWDFGDGTTSDLAGPIEHTYAATGPYMTSLTISDGTDTRTVQREVTIQSLNLPLSIDGPDTVIVGQEATFSKNGTDLLNSFSWSEPTGNTGMGESFTTSWDAVGTYNLRLDAGSDEVCSAAAIKPVVVVMETSTNDADEVEALTLFPNPVGQTLNFELKTSKVNNVYYRVVDALGREVLQQQMEQLPNNGPISIEVGQLPSASYLLIISDDNGRRLATRRFMKR